MRKLDVPYGTIIGLASTLGRVDGYNPETYPPVNIIKTGDYSYEIQLAVAGFLESDIKIQTENGYLHIRGKKETPEDENVEYIQRNIGMRSFHKRVPLADTVKVNTASLKNGILSITLEQVLPDHLKPTDIKINTHDESYKSDKQLLNE